MTTDWHDALTQAHADADRLRAERDQARAALRERDARWLAVVKEIEWAGKIEWAGNLGQNSYGCAVCQGFEEAGHQPDCALRALLEEAGK